MGKECYINVASYIVFALKTWRYQPMSNLDELFCEEFSTEFRK